MHDESTMRTGNVDLKISTSTWPQLSSVQLKPLKNISAAIPKLSEVIDFCEKNELKMLFDMKNDDLALMKKVAEEIKKRNLYEKVMVSSFNPLVPWRLKKIDPRIITGEHQTHF